MMTDSKIYKQQDDDKSLVNSTGIEYANICWQMLCSKLILLQKQILRAKTIGVNMQNGYTK